MTLLALDQVGKSYGGVVAVAGISLDLAEGSLTGLMGANGAGKSTLFGLIAGHERVSAGRIRFDGRPIERLAPDRRNRLGIARTFQIVRPFPGLSVLDNVALAAMYGRRREAPAAAAKLARVLLGELGLADRAALPAASLTLAGRKRLEVARALATAPRLLLLDEVMAGLNAVEAEAALAMVLAARARHGLTVLMVEHAVKLLLRACERLLVLHQGRLIADGPAAAVAADPAVVTAYLGASP